MPTPSHGIFCSSRTFPTPCRYCGDDIFVYQCSCGSVVLFDELGGDWPQHRLACYLNPGDARGPSDEEISNWIRSEFRQVLSQMRPSDIQFVSIEPNSSSELKIEAVMALRELPKETRGLRKSTS